MDGLVPVTESISAAVLSMGGVTVDWVLPLHVLDIPGNIPPLFHTEDDGVVADGVGPPGAAVNWSPQAVFFI